MANDNSDYNLPRTKLHELLPEPYQSDVNKSVFENLFNRFLTKQETRKVAGYIGVGNPEALVSRQIAEPTIDRQAFQLQPILYNKVGSVEHMASWKDIQNELTRLGVDISRLPEWGQAQVFNWVPPIDIDKIIRYQDYFWVDPGNPTSQPQYITIRSRCTTATASANFHQRLVDEFGETFPISNIGFDGGALPTFSILSIISASDTFRVLGDATTDLISNQYFNVTGTVSNNGEYLVLSSTYDAGNDWTNIVVTTNLTVDEAIGTVNVQRFNQLVIPGEYERLLEPGFIFFFKNSLNTDINDSFLTVTDVNYNETLDVTTINIDVVFTCSENTGDVSLREQLDIFLTEQTCQCDGTIGWDIFSWDDNPTEPLWDGDLVPFLAGISNAGPPVGTPTDGTLWYDTVADQLSQYSLATGWKILYNNFSTILGTTEGFGLWDYTEGCGEQSKIEAGNQWIDQNKWTHKTDVTNFSIAKQAQIPIIEYDWDLELNEWSFTDYVWKYRAENFDSFQETTGKPDYIELVPLDDWGVGAPNEIVFDERYGDLTDSFTPGSFFQTQDTTDIFEVVSSTYEASAAGQSYKTQVVVTVVLPVGAAPTGVIGAGPGRPNGVAPLRPFRTSQGDPWKAYHDHWLFVEAVPTTAINHQEANPFVDAPETALTSSVDFSDSAVATGAPPVSGTGTEGDYNTTPYAQNYTIQTTTTLTTFYLSGVAPPGWALDRSLIRRALVGADDVRVYINDVRVFGTYEEISSAAVVVTDAITGISEDVFYVEGIEFNAGFSPQQFDEVRIEVGEGSIKEFGNYAVPVRTIEANDDFENLASGGTRTISLVQCRKAEQVKTLVNQYPLFDIYDTTGASARLANSLFCFQTSSDAVVNRNVGQRIVVDDTGTDYSFEQFLCNADTNALYAYRDYSNETGLYWVDPVAQTVKFWTGLIWSENGLQGLQYIPATVQQAEPASPFTGQVWLDTVTNELKIYDGASFVVESAANIDLLEYDITLQTIWKKGLNDETYIPALVDWKNRTLEEYNAAMELFIEERAEEIIGTTTLTLPQAIAQATTEWFTSQEDPLSPTGVWIGDWEIPDPLYFNNQHENRKVLMSSELLSHFNSIVNSQPNLPGFNGPSNARFHLIPTEDVNYGLGGTIHEYNNAFDTFLSSIFVNNVTPPTLYEFAHDQYESLLNVLKEDFRDEARDLMTNITAGSLTDFTTFATDNIIGAFEQNDNASFLYGDSTTFTEGNPDLGLRNWIATLPYLNLVDRRDPEYLIDESREINELVHHDGHREDYTYTAAAADGIARLTVNTIDTRSTLAAPDNTFGKISSTLPPNNIVEFASGSFFGETILGRAGVYWYQVSADRTLYRLEVAAVGPAEPSVSFADGTLWMDMNSGVEVLRIKNGVNWDVVSGLAVGDGRLHNGTTPSDVTTSTISAWQVFNLDEILGNILLESESRLYSNAPTPVVLDFDFATLQDTPAKAALYAQLLEAQFLSFTRQSEITAPLVNGDFDQLDPFTWNYKRSAPGQPYEILDADSIANTFEVDGDQTSAFPGPATPFFVKNSGVNDGAFTATGSVFVGTTTVITVDPAFTVTDSLIGIIYKGQLPNPNPSSLGANTGAESGGDWRDYYQKLYGTPYPHLEPWKLQGYIDKPTWWEAEYRNDDVGTYGNRRWKQNAGTGMWANITAGIVPLGELLPDGTTVSTVPNQLLSDGITRVPVYAYFSVNIEDISITSDGGVTNFAPDEVFPPFFNHLAAQNSQTLAPFIVGPNTRSVFSNFGVEIVSPAANYAFGDAGPVEYEWRASSQFLYDQLIIAFQIDPVAFTASAFGFETDVINKLEIDSRTEQPPCHSRTEFHGEVVNNALFQVNGLNQWYVNFNRFLGFDTSQSDFRSLWTLWTAPMMYQFASFVDTASLQVAHRTVPTSEFDYNLASKRSPGADDFWLDAFDVTILYTPPNIARYDNQGNWILEVDTNSPLNRTIEHYDVHNYQFSVDPVTDTCTIYSYPIQSLDFFNETFSIQGNQTEIFPFGRSFDIVGSSGNDATYTVVTSVYDASADETIIEIGTAIPNAISDGNIVADYRSVPWETGDSIWFSTEETLPAPLKGDQVAIGPTRYFVIRLNDSQFKVANTNSNALANLPIDITTSGRRNSFVGQIRTTFRALGGNRTDTLWRHYEVDRTNTLSFTPPFDIKGMQTLVNIVDGYEQFTYDEGFRINDLKQQQDPDTGRHVDWQVETERFIDFAYGQRLTRNRNIDNRYSVTVSEVTDVWTFSAETPANLVTGNAVNVISSGVYPAPIISNLKYYIIRDSITEFRLATTRKNAQSGIAIDILTSTNGTLDITAAADFREAFPSQRINPFRNALFFRPERGIVSNLLTGPSEDIRNTQLLFDQYGRPLNRKQIRIFREDDQTQVSVIDGLANDVQPFKIFRDPYNYLHLGGAHIFIDAYEHVLIFNNYTSEDALLYDSFLGLNVTKFEMLFNRQVEFTQRPNVGGSYFKTFFNQGAELLENFETSVDNIRNLYDSYRVVEAKRTVQEARKSLGYEGTRTYLDNMNLNEKSQFLFWRGLIQTKGSIQSVKAFVNSRRFIDALVDEFWAYKIADFGSVEDKEYPEMYLTTTDARTAELRLQFIEEGDFCQPGFGEGGYDDELCGFDISPEDALATDPGFTPIVLTDQDRWFNQPDQLETLRNQGLSLNWNLKPIGQIPTTISTTSPPDPQDGDGWIRIVGLGREFNRWNAATSTFDNHGVWTTPAETPLLRHNFSTDNEVITVETQPVGTRLVLVADDRTAPAVPGATVGFRTVLTELKTVVLPFPYAPFTNHIKVFRNGTQLDNLIEWVETVDGFGSDFSTELVVVAELDENDVVEVIYNRATMIKDLHYERVSSNTLRFISNEFIDFGINLTIVGENVNEPAQTPAKIIDRESKTVVTPVQIWDPARGVQYKTALTTVNLDMANDPAIYTNTIETDQLPPGSTVRPYILYNDPWNNTEVGTTWLDTANLDYKTYYDNVAIPELEDRLRVWGELADWGDLSIYEWVESDVPPSEYDAIAISEEGDRDIPEHLRKAGRARKAPFESLDSGVTWIPLLVKYQEFDVVIDGTEIQPGDYDFTLDLTPANNNILAGDIINVYVNGRLFESSAIAATTMSVLGINESDRVRFVKPIPDDATIEADPFLDSVYEYTEVPNFDQFGIQGSVYYFWVGDKGTRNLKQEISPADAQLQLITIPTPYMLTMKSLPAVTRTSGVLQDLERSWVHVINDDDLAHFVELGRNIILLSAAVKEQDIANISVTLNASPLIATTDFTLSATGRSVEIDVDFLTSNQTEANYPGGGSPDGDFTPGIGYAALDTIELDDGSILTVNAVAAGLVTGFTVTNPAGVSTTPGVTLLQNSSSGAGLGFTLTPEINNIGLGLHDQVAFDYTTEIPTDVFNLPDRNVEAVIRGLRGIVTDNRRYTLRFLRDFTLRDNLETGTSSLNLKNAHQEWQLIREQQPFLITRPLWDRVTEAIVGFKLDSPGTRVPSLERELYDTTYGTDTRIGLRDNQSFTEGLTALQTILADLQNPENEFPAVDINAFFASNSFDTADNIIAAMDTIYSTFTFTDVNRMWFEVLHDAFSFKQEYPDIFKTSMVAIHGIRPFQVAGLFDD